MRTLRVEHPSTPKLMVFLSSCKTSDKGSPQKKDTPSKSGISSFAPFKLCPEPFAAGAGAEPRGHRPGVRAEDGRAGCPPALRLRPAAGARNVSSGCVKRNGSDPPCICCFRGGGGELFSGTPWDLRETQRKSTTRVLYCMCLFGVPSFGWGSPNET